MASTFYRYLRRFFFIAIVSGGMTGCALRSPQEVDLICQTKGIEKQVVVASEEENHWLYKVVPRHRYQIYWYDIGHWCSWALFGNDDDGIFGEVPTAGTWTEQQIGLRRALSWQCRNPLHNFNFYVIGSAGRKNSEFALIKLSSEECRFFHYEKEAKTVFGGKSSSFFFGFHGWKPFISLRIKYFSRFFEFYLGWRERGNFGIKLSPARRAKEEEEEKEPPC